MCLQDGHLRSVSTTTTACGTGTALWLSGIGLMMGGASTDARGLVTGEWYGDLDRGNKGCGEGEVEGMR